MAHTNNSANKNDSGFNILSTTAWILANVASSVSIIFVNKFVLKQLPGTVLALTAAHYAVAALALEIMRGMRRFKGKTMPTTANMFMACAGVASVTFMNLSLQYNSVGFYQIIKLACIPTMIVLQTTFYGQVFYPKVRAVLTLLLIGVGVTTITDVHLNTKGCIMGVLAVTSTAEFQILMGDSQKRYSMSPMQINHAQALPSFVICAFFSAVFEREAIANLWMQGLSHTQLIYVVASCLLAVGVQQTSYGLIGATSPVTFQVVGHLKTCLVLLAGFVMYPVHDHSAFLKQLCGIAVAMIAVSIYTNIKLNELSRTPDWLDKLGISRYMGLEMTNKKVR